MIRALIFDFDGLIVDTEGPDFKSFSELFERYGATLSLERWGEYVGVPVGTVDMYGHLQELVDKPLDRAVLRAERLPRYHALIEDKPVLPGVNDYINEAKRRGMKVGIASSADREWVEGHLGKRGMLEAFDCIRTRDDVARAKPHPDLYVSVLEYFQLTPDDAIVFEDSPNGIRAAKAAGIFTVAVPNPVTSMLDLSEADWEVSSLADISLEELLARRNCMHEDNTPV
jgi:HAD superfamily hydrolase (TIGR01509 family)